MTELCPKVCENKNSYGYCKTTYCINPLVRMGGLDYQYGFTQGYAKAIAEAEPNSCKYWDSESRFCALRRPQAVSEKSYEQGVKDALDRYDETCRIASDIRTAMGCKTAKECRELISNGEIQRVKHRKWKLIAHPLYECSECGERTAVVNLNGKVLWNYCPNCGAKMMMDEVEK